MTLCQRRRSGDNLWGGLPYFCILTSKNPLKYGIDEIDMPARLPHATRFLPSQPTSESLDGGIKEGDIRESLSLEYERHSDCALSLSVFY